jgi:hypothetical protein
MEDLECAAGTMTAQAFGTLLTHIKQVIVKKPMLLAPCYANCLRPGELLQSIGESNVILALSMINRALFRYNSFPSSTHLSESMLSAGDRAVKATPPGRPAADP